MHLFWTLEAQGERISHLTLEYLGGARLGCPALGGL